MFELIVTKEDPSGKKKGGRIILKEPRAFVYHTNLMKYVTGTIAMLKEKNMLVLDKPGVEKKRIEILWSGDKSDDTYLFSWQVMNIEYPQSQDNARPALLFEASDCYENLDKCFERSNLGTFSWFHDSK